MKHELAPDTELNGSRQRLILSRKAWNANVTLSLLNSGNVQLECLIISTMSSRYSQIVFYVLEIFINSASLAFNLILECGSNLKFENLNFSTNTDCTILGAKNFIHSSIC